MTEIREYYLEAIHRKLLCLKMLAGALAFCQCDQIGEISPLWQTFTTLCHLLRTNIQFGNILNIYWQIIYAIGQIFNCCKRPNIAHLIKPSGHTAWNWSRNYYYEIGSREDNIFCRIHISRKNKLVKLNFMEQPCKTNFARMQLP